MTPYFIVVEIPLFTISVPASHHINRRWMFQSLHKLILPFSASRSDGELKWMILKGVLAFTASGLSYEHCTTWRRLGYYNTLKTPVLCREALLRRRTSIWDNTTIKYKKERYDEKTCKLCCEVIKTEDYRKWSWAQQNRPDLSITLTFTLMKRRPPPLVQLVNTLQYNTRYTHIK